MFPRLRPAVRGLRLKSIAISASLLTAAAVGAPVATLAAAPPADSAQLNWSITWSGGRSVLAGTSVGLWLEPAPVQVPAGGELVWRLPAGEVRTTEGGSPVLPAVIVAFEQAADLSTVSVEVVVNGVVIETLTAQVDVADIRSVGVAVDDLPGSGVRDGVSLLAEGVPADNVVAQQPAVGGESVLVEGDAGDWVGTPPAPGPGASPSPERQAAAALVMYLADNGILTAEQATALLRNGDLIDELGYRFGLLRSGQPDVPVGEFLANGLVATQGVTDLLSLVSITPSNDAKGPGIASLLLASARGVLPTGRRYGDSDAEMGALGLALLDSLVALDLLDGATAVSLSRDSVLITALGRSLDDPTSAESIAAIRTLAAAAGDTLTDVLAGGGHSRQPMDLKVHTSTYLNGVTHSTPANASQGGQIGVREAMAAWLVAGDAREIPTVFADYGYEFNGVIQVVDRLGHKLEATNNDDLTIVLGGVTDNGRPDGNSGDDVVIVFGGLDDDSEIDTDRGDDTVLLFGWAGDDSDVFGNRGDDEVLFVGSSGDNMDFKGHQDDDFFLLSGSISDTDVKLGSGNDEVIVVGSGTNDFNFDGSRGQDRFDLRGVFRDGRVDGDSGSDVFSLRGDLSRSYVEFDSGNDRATIEGSITSTRFKTGRNEDTVDYVGLLKNSLVHLGRGNDVFNFVGQLVGSKVDGRRGDDRFSLDGSFLRSEIDGGKSADTIDLRGIGYEGFVVDLGKNKRGNDTLVVNGDFAGDLSLKDPKHSFVYKGSTKVHEQDIVLLLGEGWEQVDDPNGGLTLRRVDTTTGAVLSEVQVIGDASHLEQIVASVNPADGAYAVFANETPEVKRRTAAIIISAVGVAVGVASGFFTAGTTTALTLAAISAAAATTAAIIDEEDFGTIAFNAVTSAAGIAGGAGVSGASAAAAGARSVKSIADGDVLGAVLNAGSVGLNLAGPGVSDDVVARYQQAATGLQNIANANGDILKVLAGLAGIASAAAPGASADESDGIAGPNNGGTGPSPTAPPATAPVTGLGTGLSGSIANIGSGITALDAALASKNDGAVFDALVALAGLGATGADLAGSEQLSKDITAAQTALKVIGDVVDEDYVGALQNAAVLFEQTGFTSQTKLEATDIPDPDNPGGFLQREVQINVAAGAARLASAAAIVLRGIGSGDLIGEAQKFYEAFQSGLLTATGIDATDELAGIVGLDKGEVEKLKGTKLRDQAGNELTVVFDEDGNPIGVFDVRGAPITVFEKNGDDTLRVITPDGTTTHILDPDTGELTPINDVLPVPEPVPGIIATSTVSVGGDVLLADYSGEPANTTLPLEPDDRTAVKTTLSEIGLGGFIPSDTNLAVEIGTSTNGLEAGGTLVRDGRGVAIVYEDTVAATAKKFGVTEEEWSTWVAIQEAAGLRIVPTIQANAAKGTQQRADLLLSAEVVTELASVKSFPELGTKLALERVLFTPAKPLYKGLTDAGRAGLVLAAGDLGLDLGALQNILDGAAINAKNNRAGERRPELSIDSAAHPYGTVYEEVIGEIVKRTAQSRVTVLRVLRDRYVEALKGHATAHAGALNQLTPLPEPASSGNDGLTSLGADVLLASAGVFDVPTDLDIGSIAQTVNEAAFVRHEFSQIDWGPDAVAPPEITPGMVSDTSGPRRGQPTVADRELARHMWLVGQGARATKAPVAGSMLLHYLGGSGRPYRLDVVKMRVDNEFLSSQIDKEEKGLRDRMLRAAKEQFAAAGIVEPTQFPGAGWRSGKASVGLNWFFAVNEMSYAVTGTISINPLGQVVMETQTHVYDRYDWDRVSTAGAKTPQVGGLGVTVLPERYVEDREMARLHQTGLAQDFPVQGSQTQRYVFDLGPRSESPAPNEPFLVASADAAGQTPLLDRQSAPGPTGDGRLATGDPIDLGDVIFGTDESLRIPESGGITFGSDVDLADVSIDEVVWSDEIDLGPLDVVEAGPGLLGGTTTEPDSASTVTPSDPASVIDLSGETPRIVSPEAQRKALTDLVTVREEEGGPVARTTDELDEMLRAGGAIRVKVGDDVYEISTEGTQTTPAPSPEAAPGHAGADDVANGPEATDDPKNPFKAPVFATTGVFADWMLQRGLQPDLGSVSEGVILKRLAPTLSRGFVQNLVLGGALPSFNTGDPISDLFLNTFKNASAAQAISVTSRRGLDPLANAVLRQRRIEELSNAFVDDRTVALSPDPAAVPNVEPRRSGPFVAPAPTGSPRLQSAPQIDAHWGLQSTRNGVPVTTSEHINVRHGFFAGQGETRFTERTRLREVKALVDEALRFGHVGVNSHGNGFTVYHDSGRSIGVGSNGTVTGVVIHVKDGIIRSAYPVDTATYPNSTKAPSWLQERLRRADQLRSAGRTGTGPTPLGDAGAVTFTPLTPETTATLDPKTPAPDISEPNVKFEAVFGLPWLGSRADGTPFGSTDPLTAPQSTKIQRITDGTILGINIGAPVLEFGTVKLLEVLGLDDNYLISTGARALSTGTAVGIPISIAQKRFVTGAFVVPTGQAAVAIVISDVLFSALPDDAKQVVIDTCSADNPILNGLKWFACNVGQKPPTPQTPQTPPESGGGPPSGSPPAAPSGSPAPVVPSAGPVGSAASPSSSALEPSDAPPGLNTPTFTVDTPRLQPTGLEGEGAQPTRSGRDGVTQTLDRVYDLIGDGSGGTGSVQIYRGPDGSGEAVIVAPKTDRNDGTRVVYYPEIGGTGLTENHLADQVNEVRGLDGDESGQPTGSRPVVIRLWSHSYEFQGDGSVPGNGSVFFFPNASNPEMQDVSVLPISRFNDDASESILTQIPEGQPYSEDHQYTVPVGTRMVTKRVDVPSPFVQPEFEPVAPSNDDPSGPNGPVIVNNKVPFNRPKVRHPSVSGTASLPVGSVGGGASVTPKLSPIDHVVAFSNQLSANVRKQFAKTPVYWQTAREWDRTDTVTPTLYPSVGPYHLEIHFLDGTWGRYRTYDGGKQSGTGPESFDAAKLFNIPLPTQSRQSSDISQTVWFGFFFRMLRTAF